LPTDAGDVTLLPDGSWKTTEEEEDEKVEPTVKKTPTQGPPDVVNHIFKAFMITLV